MPITPIQYPFNQPCPPRPYGMPLYQVQENPRGAIDGTNTIFTLSLTPLAGNLSFYKNGQFQTDYTVSGNEITTATPPLSGDKLYAHYVGQAQYYGMP